MVSSGEIRKRRVVVLAIDTIVIMALSGLASGCGILGAPAERPDPPPGDSPETTDDEGGVLATATSRPDLSASYVGPEEVLDGWRLAWATWTHSEDGGCVSAQGLAVADGYLVTRLDVQGNTELETAATIHLDEAGSADATVLADGLEVRRIVAAYDLAGGLSWWRGATAGYGVLEGFDAEAGEGRSALAGRTWSGLTLDGGGNPDGTIDASGVTGFLARYDEDGLLGGVGALPVRSLTDDTGDSHLAMNGVAVDPTGGLFLALDFFGALTLDAGQVSEREIAKPYEGEARSRLLVAYGDDGRVAWEVEVGRTLLMYTSALVVEADGTGGVYVSGAFDSEMTLGAGEADETTLEPVGGESLFLARYDAAGRLLFARDLGVRPTMSGTVSGLARLDDGDLLVQVVHDGSAEVGVGEGGATMSATEYGQAIFTARFSSDGTRRWARQLAIGGGDSLHLGAGLADGGLVGAGSLSREITLGQGEERETSLVARGKFENPMIPGTDGYLALFAEDGSLQETLRIGGSGTDQVIAAVTVAATTTSPEQLVVVGQFNRAFWLDTGHDDGQVIGNGAIDDPVSCQTMLLAFERI